MQECKLDELKKNPAPLWRILDSLEGITTLMVFTPVALVFGV